MPASTSARVGEVRNIRGSRTASARRPRAFGRVPDRRFERGNARGSADFIFVFGRQMASTASSIKEMGRSVETPTRQTFENTKKEALEL